MGKYLKLKFTFLMTLLILCSSFAFAAEDSGLNENAEYVPEVNIVRVGYYDSDLFQQGISDDAVKSGYGYEYLQKIADYAGWKYEYVYGSWTEIFPKLFSGEIDVMAGISMTPDRMGKIFFPKTKMGDECYYIYQHGNGTMVSDDIESFRGMKIGGIENNLMTTCLEHWKEETGADITIINYKGFAERDNAFESGVLDGIVATDNNVSIDANIYPVLKVGEEPYYLAVSKQRPDLLAELDHAIMLMEELDPFFLQTLQESSYGNTMAGSRLTLEETEWLVNNSELKVGYLNNLLPYCGTKKNGEAFGLMTDVFSEMLYQLKLQDTISVTYKGYSSYEEMLNAIWCGEVDAIFPATGGGWYIEQDGLDATSPVLTVGMDIVYKGSYSDRKFKRIAVNRNNRMQLYFCNINFPDSQIIYEESIDDCLEAVEKGRADCTVINGLRIDQLLRNNRHSSLSFLQISRKDEMCIGVESGNYPLLVLLNRGLKVIGREYGINTSYKYVNEIYTFTFKDFMQKYSVVVLLIIVITLALVVYYLARYNKRMKAEKLEREKYLKELETARRESKTAQKESHTDEMTGFNNRRAYDNDLKEVRMKGFPENYVLVSLDINGLKEMNDTMGHTAGDELIVGAASCIKEAFGAVGKMYRIGGDEFEVICQTSLRVVQAAVSNLKEITAAWHGQNVKNLSISAGYAGHSEFNGELVDQLEHIADKRMYEDKSLYYNNRNDRRENKSAILENVLRSYIKVLKVDLISDTFQVIKIDEKERSEAKGFNIKFSQWMTDFGAKGQVLAEDLPEYNSKTDMMFLKKYFAENKAPLHVFYSRLTGMNFKPVMLEMMRAEDYSQSNQVAYLYVKDMKKTVEDMYGLD